MKISELIAALEALRDQHGDQYVERGDGNLIGTVEPLRRNDDEDGEVIAIRVT